MLSIRPLDSDVAALRAAVPGSVVLPGDETWDAAAQAWNLAVDQRPALVALPAHADDVAALVDFARAPRPARRAAGHRPRRRPARPARRHAAGQHERDARRPDRRRAPHRPRRGRRAVDRGRRPAAEHGLAALAGSSPDVGVVGYTLGGGLSWLGRRYGLAANRVLAIEVVTADGRLVRADAATSADLFWALRGGGGTFAAVTAIEFELFPLREVYAGMLLWPWERAREVLHAWRELTRDGARRASRRRRA